MKLSQKKKSKVDEVNLTKLDFDEGDADEKVNYESSEDYMKVEDLEEELQDDGHHEVEDSNPKS